MLSSPSRVVVALDIVVVVVGGDMGVIDGVARTYSWTAWFNRSEMSAHGDLELEPVCFPEGGSGPGRERKWVCLNSIIRSGRGYSTD